MFGNFDFYNYENDSKNSEIINTKLDDKENPPSLEDILLLEGIVDELHNKNKKLINFFTKEKIKQMLDYIIKEPKDDDHNKGHKFPFLCSKIFDIEEKNMMNYFHMTNKELIENKNMNQRNSEISIEENMNIDNNEDDIAKYYKINKGDKLIMRIILIIILKMGDIKKKIKILMMIKLIIKMILMIKKMMEKIMKIKRLISMII